MAGDVHDVAIIGAGPAGVAASVYLKRVGVDPLLLERNRVGGLLANANLVENYPGFPYGVSGRDLVKLMDAQLRRWRIRVTRAGVERVALEDGLYRLETSRGEYSARFVIVATGTRPKGIGLRGEELMAGKRLFSEVVQIPQALRGGTSLIIGGGDAAFDYALNLAADGGSVSVIFKSGKPACIPLLLARSRVERAIRLFPETVPESVQEENGKIVLACRKAGRRTSFRGDLVLIACGREPNLDFLPARLRRAALKGEAAPKTPRLFMAGDVKRGHYRQVGIAVGDGIAAAMAVAEQIHRED